MGNVEFLERCRQVVVDYFNEKVEKTDNKKITIGDVFIVWCCKTLQNNKALCSTTVSDGMYYEITYNGDKKELYLDAYKKWENVLIED
jgi:hypothetical protein